MTDSPNPTNPNTPPALPPQANARTDIAQISFWLSVLAFVVAIPVLWFRLMEYTGGASIVKDVVDAVTIAPPSLPAWFTAARATATLAAFLSLIALLTSLVMKQRDRRQGLCCVLLAGAMLACWPFISSIVIVGFIALAIVAITLGIA